MGDWKKRVCGWRTAPSSSSSKLWLFMVPLVMVTLFLGLVGSKNSNWVISTNYYPRWAWSNSLPFSSSPSAGGAGTAEIELRPRVVAGHGGREEAVSDDYNLLNRSSSPTLPIEAERNQESVTVADDEHDLNIEESLNITVNPTHNFSSFNQTQAPPAPPTERSQREFKSLERLEAGLCLARAAIRDAKNGTQINDPDYVPSGPMYWNPKVFHRSYLEMEKLFKIFVYEEGEPPVFHNGPCKSIYAMEGNFIYNMEMSKFRTRDPERALVYFLPISVTAIVHFVYERDHNWLPMRQTVRDYVDLLAGKYPFWNRSLGADHFMLACHDWGPELSSSVPYLYKNSIRALCNANTSEGFKPFKDVSFPEILLPGGTLDGLIGGPSPSKRPYLAFFAGGVHGPIRPVLLDHWENKMEDIQVHKYLPKGVSYYGMMKKSKYCLCPSGYEVASPRMVEALYTGCVPVLIKDHYVPPFSDVLNWKSFSVEIPVRDIPKLKEILMSISNRQYIRMQRRGKVVRRHFEVNLPPKRFDVFHMILHSVWLRRLNVRIRGIADS